MTPADEATFIALWSQGLSQDAIAQQLGCPVGMVKSRAHTLAHQGKIQARPRGGAYPHRRAKTRPEDPPAAPTAPAPPAPQVTPAPPAMTFVAVPEIQEMLSLMKDLQARVISLEQMRVPPVLPAPPATPAPPAAERKVIQQWTVRLSKTLIDHLKAVAYARRIPPSQLVEDWLWQQAHHDRSPSTP
jgi:hypothetical protein